MPLILVRPIWQTMTRKSSDSCSLGRTCAPTPGNSASSRRLSSMVNCQKGARMSCFPAPASTSSPLSRRSATARRGSPIRFVTVAPVCLSMIKSTCSAPSMTSARTKKSVRSWGAMHEDSPRSFPGRRRVKPGKSYCGGSFPSEWGYKLDAREKLLSNWHPDSLWASVNVANHVPQVVTSATEQTPIKCHALPEKHQCPGSDGRL